MRLPILTSFTAILITIAAVAGLEYRRDGSAPARGIAGAGATLIASVLAGAPLMLIDRSSPMATAQASLAPHHHSPVCHGRRGRHRHSWKNHGGHRFCILAGNAVFCDSRRVGDLDHFDRTVRPHREKDLGTAHVLVSRRRRSHQRRHAPVLFRIPGTGLYFTNHMLIVLVVALLMLAIFPGCSRPPAAKRPRVFGISLNLCWPSRAIRSFAPRWGKIPTGFSRFSGR